MNSDRDPNQMVGRRERCTLGRYFFLKPQEKGPPPASINTLGEESRDQSLWRRGICGEQPYDCLSTGGQFPILRDQTPFQLAVHCPISGAKPASHYLPPPRLGGGAPLRLEAHINCLCPTLVGRQKPTRATDRRPISSGARGCGMGWYPSSRCAKGTAPEATPPGIRNLRIKQPRWIFPGVINNGLKLHRGGGKLCGGLRGENKDILRIKCGKMRGEMLRCRQSFLRHKDLQNSLHRRNEGRMSGHK